MDIRSNQKYYGVDFAYVHNDYDKDMDFPNLGYNNKFMKSPLSSTSNVTKSQIYSTIGIW